MEVPGAFEQFKDFGRDEEIDGRVAIHDSDHVEVKLNCRLGTGTKSRYRIETYFFIPRSLGLNSASYSQQHFYNDVQTYIRFKTPTIPLSTLTEQIRELMGVCQASPRDQAAHQKLSYELRMFGCVARAMMRDRINAIGERIGALPDDNEQYQVLVEDVSGMTANFVEEIEQVRDEWRDMRPSFVDVKTKAESREMYLHVDEFLSLVTEENMTLLIHCIDESESLNGQLSNIRGRLCELVLAERDYRTGAGYSSANMDGSGESFVYRRSMLKKLVTSVLWLDVSKRHDGSALSDAIAMTAAGAAMLFAVVAMIFATQVWMLNTAAFVAAAVVSYMLKDRIKDWLKRYFSRRMNRLIPDHHVNIRDPLTKEDIGSSRETFAYISADRVPQEVWRLRHKQARSAVELGAKQEVIMRYDKEIRLRSKEVLQRMHLEDYNLNDITRFALWQLLIRADDPKYPIAMYDAEDDCVEKRSFRRVYHLNIVMVFHAGSKGNETATMQHLRVIFDKQKIRRLEHVVG